MAILNVADVFKRHLNSSTLVAGDEIVTPKYTTIDVGSSGNNTLVSAVSGKKIRVLSYVFIANGAVTVEWRTGTTTTLSGAMGLAASAGISAPFSPVGHFETASGEALTINLGSAVNIDGHITYIEV